MDEFLGFIGGTIACFFIAGVLLCTITFVSCVVLDGVNTCFTPEACAAEGNP